MDCTDPMRPSCHGQAGKRTQVATHAKGAARTQPEKGTRMQGGGDGYAGRELNIGPLEKNRRAGTLRHFTKT